MKIVFFFVQNQFYNKYMYIHINDKTKPILVHKK